MVERVASPTKDQAAMVGLRFDSAHPTCASRKTRSQHDLILSIPIEARLAILFVLGCCLGAVINLGIYRLAWNPAADRPLVAAAPRRPAAAVLGSGAGNRLAGAEAGSQLARRRLLDPADVAGTADRGRVRTSVLVGGRPMRPGAADTSQSARRHRRSWRRLPCRPSGTSSSSPTWFCSASCSWPSGSTSMR